MLQNWSCDFHSNCQNTFWTFIKRSLRFFTIDNRRKKKAKFFSSLKRLLFFQIICFQQPLRCYRNDLVTSPVIVRRLLDYNLPPSFVPLDNARKKRPKSFLHWAGCLFFKKLCFQRPVPHRTDLITSTVSVILPCGPL